MKMKTLFRTLFAADEVIPGSGSSKTQGRSPFNDNPIGRYLIARSGDFIDVNAALIDLLGYSDRDSLMSHNLHQLFVDPEERRRWQRRIDRKGQLRRFISQMRRVDGSILWVRENSLAVKDQSGHVLSYEGSLEDITEVMGVDTSAGGRASEYPEYWSSLMDWRHYF